MIHPLPSKGPCASRCTQCNPENQRKWIPLDRPPLWLQGKTVKEVESYKYLGIHVSAQLKWTIQAQKGIANATKWVMQFHRLTWILTGLSIQLLHQLYITVVIPKMTYAIDIWYTPLTKPPGHRRSVGSVGVLWQMTKLQRMASLGIIGHMRSTPTDLLDAHTGLLPIDLTLFWICHRATVHLCSLPPSHPLHSIVRAAHLSQNKKHVNPIKSTLRIFELDPHKFETISPNTTPPEHLAKIKAIIPREKDKAITAELKDEADLNIFTDGSGKDRQAGTSAVLFQKDNPNAIKSLTYHIGELLKHTIEEAELIGALMGIWLLHTMPGSARCSVTFYTDSQIVIHRLSHRFMGSGSYIVNSICSHVDWPLKFAWIPSHEDVHGNMEADALVALTARGHSSPADTAVARLFCSHAKWIV